MSPTAYGGAQMLGFKAKAQPSSVVASYRVRAEQEHATSKVLRMRIRSIAHSAVPEKLLCQEAQPVLDK
jgi:hypothetical protein